MVNNKVINELVEKKYNTSIYNVIDSILMPYLSKKKKIKSKKHKLITYFVTMEVYDYLNDMIIYEMSDYNINSVLNMIDIIVNSYIQETYIDKKNIEEKEFFIDLMKIELNECFID